MLKNNKKGFTIIEVVLVLAIAGLIFLMVFLAFPALQKSQRDTQRKKILSMYVDAIHRYKANNRNVMPELNSYNRPQGNLDATNNAWILADYLTDEMKRDPSGIPYSVLGDSGGGDDLNTLEGFHRQWREASSNPQWQIYFGVGGSCERDDVSISPRSSFNRNDGYFFWTFLEGGGIHCADAI